MPTKNCRKFHPIEVLHGLCEVDTLDHRQLRDGESLRVRWPDGTETIENIVVTTTFVTIRDEGRIDDIPIVKAHARGEVHGVVVLIPLAKAGVTAKRVRQ